MPRSSNADGRRLVKSRDSRRRPTIHVSRVTTRPTGCPRTHGAGRAQRRCRNTKPEISCTASLGPGCNGSPPEDREHEPTDPPRGSVVGRALAPTLDQRSQTDRLSGGVRKRPRVSGRSGRGLSAARMRGRFEAALMGRGVPPAARHRGAMAMPGSASGPEARRIRHRPPIVSALSHRSSPPAGR